jgi:hypothetical protein
MAVPFIWHKWNPRNDEGNIDLKGGSTSINSEVALVAANLIERRDLQEGENSVRHGCVSRVSMS